MREVLNRKAYIGHHGTICKGCGFDFEKTYGDLGKDFNHAHYKTPLKTIGESYKIDPVRNMVPLCPKCYAMVHRANESRPLSVEALHIIIDEAKKRAGATGSAMMVSSYPFTHLSGKLKS